jgi:hypothetical protein
MPIVPLPITGPAFQNADEITLSKFSAALIDGYVDALGNSIRRPGLLSFFDVATDLAIDGLYYWKRQSVVIVVSGGNVYKVTQAGVITDLTGDNLIAGTRVSFAFNGTYLVMANGGRMVYTDGTANTAFIGDGDAPTAVTHVAFLDTYILCNNVNTGKFHWSDVGTALNWSALSFATAEGSPDYVIALYVAWREVMLFGEESTEVWFNDGTTPFARLSQGYTEGGCGAAYSVQFADNTWFYLDDNRRVVRLVGRTPKIMSGPYDKVIQKLTTISDAIGNIINIEGQAFYVITFPSDNLTLAYNYKDESWSQWGYWNESTVEHDCWIGNDHVFISDWAVHLVGSRVDGKVYKMSHDYYDDAGNTVRKLRRTGHIDHDTFQRKRSREIILKLKRGVGKTDNLDPNDEFSMPYATIKWRDNGNSVWKKERAIPLNRIGDTEFIHRMRAMGVYKTRQYEIVVTDKTDFILVGGEEDVVVLR